MNLQPASTQLLCLKNHTINRGGFALCQGINLQLDTGRICHLVGANGTGKTTLMMQLAGLLPIVHQMDMCDDIDKDFDKDFSKDDNEGVEIDNQQILSEIYYCGKVGLPIKPVYISHQIGIHLNLTVEQNIQFLLNLYGVTATEYSYQQALSWVGLDGYEKTPCYQLSAGQTRRVNLARLRLMTVADTKLWLLDEPFTALDIEMVAKLQERIKEFANSGGAVLMTSHQIANMDRLADFKLDLSVFTYV